MIYILLTNQRTYTIIKRKGHYCLKRRRYWRANEAIFLNDLIQSPRFLYAPPLGKSTTREWTQFLIKNCKICPLRSFSVRLSANYGIGELSCNIVLLQNNTKPILHYMFLYRFCITYKLFKKISTYRIVWGHTYWIQHFLTVHLHKIFYTFH